MIPLGLADLGVGTCSPFWEAPTSRLRIREGSKWVSRTKESLLSLGLGAHGSMRSSPLSSRLPVNLFSLSRAFHLLWVDNVRRCPRENTPDLTLWNKHPYPHSTQYKREVHPGSKRAGTGTQAVQSWSLGSSPRTWRKHRGYFKISKWERFFKVWHKSRYIKRLIYLLSYKETTSWLIIITTTTTKTQTKDKGSTRENRAVYASYHFPYYVMSSSKSIRKSLITQRKIRGGGRKKRYE